MNIFCSIIECVFEIKDRGVVVAPGITRDRPSVKVGETIILELPDGSKLLASVKGIKFIKFKDPVPSPREVALLLGTGLTKSMIPVGTKIWVSAPDCDKPRCS